MSGYDLVVEVSEEFLNRSIDVLYQEGIIPRKYSGEYSLQIPLIPREYQKTVYEIKLKETPSIDALSENLVNIKFGAEVKLGFGLLHIISETKGLIRCKPVYNRAANRLELNIVEVDLEKITLQGFLLLPEPLVNALNDIITDLMTEGLKDIDNIPVSPIVGNLELPEMPEGNRYMLPVGFGAVEIIDDNTVVLGFDIAAEGTGAKTKIINSNYEGDLVIGVSKSAISKIIGFWWQNTTYPKKTQFKGRIPIKNIDKLLDYLSNYSVELIPKLFSLGFVELDWNLIDVWLDYEGTVLVSEPKVSLKDEKMRIEIDSIVDIVAYLRLELDVAVEFDTSGPIPDALTPWKDDRTVGKDRRVIEAMRYTANQKQVSIVDPDAKLLLDDDQRIVLKFGEFDLDLGLNWRLPRRLVKRMEKNIEKNFKTQFPSIPLSPSIVKQRIEDTDLILELDVADISQRKNALTVKANIEYKKDQREP